MSKDKTNVGVELSEIVKEIIEWKEEIDKEINSLRRVSDLHSGRLNLHSKEIKELKNKDITLQRESIPTTNPNGISFKYIMVFEYLLKCLRQSDLYSFIGLETGIYIIEESYINNYRFNLYINNKLIKGYNSLDELLDDNPLIIDILISNIREG